MTHRIVEPVARTNIYMQNNTANYVKTNKSFEQHLKEKIESASQYPNVNAKQVIMLLRQS